MRWAALALGALLTIPAAAQVPHLLSFQGTLADSTGAPVTGTPSIEFLLWDSATGGMVLWREFHGSIQVTDGYFAVILGHITPVTPDLFTGTDHYLQIVVSGIVVDPRQRIASNVFALVAENAVGDITPQSVAIAGVGPVIDSGGHWVGPTPAAACPVGFADMEEYCIEDQWTRGNADWDNALRACRGVGYRLCSVEELCVYSAPLTDPVSPATWSSEPFDLSAAYVGCIVPGFGGWAHAFSNFNPVRCCASKR